MRAGNGNVLEKLCVLSLDRQTTVQPRRWSLAMFFANESSGESLAHRLFVDTAVPTAQVFGKCVRQRPEKCVWFDEKTRA